MVPALRPRMPLRSGPTLFLASGPTSWQARHFLKTSAPSSALPSCAAAEPSVPIATEAATIVFRQAFMRLRVIFHLLCGSLPDKLSDGRCFSTRPFAAARGANGGADRSEIYHGGV